MRMLKNIYRIYIDVIGYVKTDKKRYDNENIEQQQKKDDDVDMGAEEDNVVADADQDEAPNNEHDLGFTDEQVKKFKELAVNPNVYDLLIDALAPSI